MSFKSRLAQLSQNFDGNSWIVAVITAIVVLVGFLLSRSVSYRPASSSVESLPSEIPQFPIPPPKASAFEVISRQLLVGSQQSVLLKDVNTALDKAFRRCGYGERSYYAVPDGFAMVARLEQINPDGTASSNRWSLDIPYMKDFSLITYFRALFRAQTPGHYRVIVFLITPHPFTQSKSTVGEAEAGAWVSGGANTLPEEIGTREYSADYNCTALIYEFELVRDHPARFVEPSELTGHMHLERAGLIAALSQRR